MREANKLPPEHTRYVLVTGANSGLGFNICTRLIKEFLRTSPPELKLYLIPTTRSRPKSADTYKRLELYISKIATSLASDSYTSQNPIVHKSKQDVASRIKIDPICVDLCRLCSIHEAAQDLLTRIPRLDILIANAGIGGWDGPDWGLAWKQFCSEGIEGILCRPKFKKLRIGRVTEPQLGLKMPAEGELDPLGEVFCANVFGHYLLVHECAKLLVRKKSEEAARVVWVSTLEAYEYALNTNDFQGLTHRLAYESSKRVMDLLVLGAHLPEERIKIHIRNLSGITNSESSLQPPDMLLCHPGICVTSIMPLHFVLVWFQTLCFYIIRLLGSIWHTCSAEKGATSAVWLSLSPRRELEMADAIGRKTGSCVNRWGKEGVKVVEIDGAGSKVTYDEVIKSWEYLEHLRLNWVKWVRRNCSNSRT